MNHEIYKSILSSLYSHIGIILQTQIQDNEGESTAIHKRLLDANDPHAVTAYQNGCPAMVRSDNISTIWEPYFPEERLIVLGGGHIALPLVDFASKTGFSVVIADDRPSFANTLRFPSAQSVLCESFEKVFESLQVTASDYVVIITRGHRYDMLCMEKLLQGTEPHYTGMIGSRRRVNALKDAMIEQGHDKYRINRVHTPIGLPIGAVTPAEIAVSILSELIACKRLGSKGHGCRSDIDMQVLRTLAEEKDVPKAVVTVIAAKGSVPRGPGAKMLVYADRRIVGSVGGGCSESEVIRLAQQLIGTGRYLLHTVDLTAEIAEEEGMVCGGVMQVLIEDY